MRIACAAFALVLLSAPVAMARAAFSCGGFALLGAAELSCSHTDPAAPPQVCSFSWTLMRTDNTATVVSGSFVLTPGLSNVVVYQAGGMSYALSEPVVLCHGGASDPEDDAP